jgi:hypothetical protein
VSVPGLGSPWPWRWSAWLRRCGVRGCAVTARLLLVDGANVVGSRPDGWWRDRPGAARRLVDELRAAVRAGVLAGPVTVVLEGAARAGRAEGEVDGVTVRHAAGSGDDLLVALAAGEGGPVVVVSADRALTRRVAELGAAVVGPSWLWRRVDRPAVPPER